MQAGAPARGGLLRSRLFWRLVAGYSAVLLFTGALVGWLGERFLEQSLLRRLESTLRADCGLLTPFAAQALRGECPELEGELRRIRAETGMRVTLILPDGHVLGDSHEDPRLMDDHSNRAEILQARAEGFGSARRFSDTLGLEMLYVARRVEVEGTFAGTVRLALPLSEIEEQQAQAGRAVLIGTAGGVCVALLLGLLLVRGLTRSISDLTHAARELAAGNYATRVASRLRAGQQDELGQLGQVLNSLGAEITARIAALSEEDAQLRAVLASMIEGVVAVDEETRIAFINQAARELLEIQEPRPEGRALWQLAPVRKLEELLADSRARGGPRQGEFELFRMHAGERGARERVLEAHVSPFDGGGRVGHVLVLHDISELRRLERVRRDFVANVSHELKTPLTSIQGFVETLLSGGLDDEANRLRFVQRIDANVKRLTNLVSDLLSLARIESGQLDVQRAEVDLRDVLDAVARLRESAWTAKGLTLAVEGDDAPLLVRGDREAMTQVLDNLLDNAIQYTNAPGRITVRLARALERGVLTVEDTGIGIPSADLERIFERFYRVDKARSRAAGGTGLGLSIVKNLVLRMEGEVRVTSTEGKGSSFQVFLPLAGRGADRPARPGD